MSANPENKRLKIRISPERLREKIDADPDACVEVRPAERCHANRDGECNHKDCPQLRDNEPEVTGRHCPIDTYGELDEDGGR